MYNAIDKRHNISQSSVLTLILYSTVKKILSFWKHSDHASIQQNLSPVLSSCIRQTHPTMSHPLEKGKEVMIIIGNNFHMNKIHHKEYCIFCEHMMMSQEFTNKQAKQECQLS